MLIENPSDAAVLRGGQSYCFWERARRMNPLMQSESNVLIVTSESIRRSTPLKH